MKTIKIYVKFKNDEENITFKAKIRLVWNDEGLNRIFQRNDKF